MRHKFDLVDYDISVRFAGEAAADRGGSLQEFFTLAMKCFPDIPTFNLGKAGNDFLKMILECFKKVEHYLLGQLAGTVIIKIG